MLATVLRSPALCLFFFFFGCHKMVRVCCFFFLTQAANQATAFRLAGSIAQAKGCREVGHGFGSDLFLQ